MSKPSLQELTQFPVALICPACREVELTAQDEHILCTACDTRFEFDKQVPDLIVGDRFPDEIDDDELRYEDECIADATHNYWLPMFRRHVRVPGGEPVTIMSMGCGTGADIDILNDAQYAAVGIDNGNRTRLWTMRKYPTRLLLANGLKMPFPDASFDVIYCGCVFPHVGVHGDTFEVTDDYLDQRQALADEMVRVLKPDGQLFMGSPNRLFPMDIFHGREAGSIVPRCNCSSDPFLLSTRDYRDLFLNAGCASAAALPVKGYWGFLRSGKTLKGKLSSLPIKGLFALASAFKPLHGSVLNPWIVVHINKAAP